MLTDVTTLIFDYGGVISTARRSKQFANWLFKEYGIDPSITHDIFHSEVWERYVIGKATSEESYAPLLALTPWLGVEDLKRTYASFGVPDPEMKSLIAHLPLPVAILSDSIPELTKVVRAHFRGLFCAEIFSEEVGLRKLNPAIYDLTLTRLNRPAYSCLFIDDKEANLEYPRRIGMKTHQFTSVGNLKIALVEQYGVPLQ